MSNYDNRDTNFSKNLYKQKYFCQMCNRQCRDKDGFNCHLKTETHKRNVEIVSRNPEEFINKYSYEFESGFLDILKRSSHDIFVSANKIFQEYISDKFSTHLNATRWSSLTGFLKHLEAKGKCEMIVTEKEIKIKYVDLSPESLREKMEKEKRIKSALQEEKRKIEEMKKMMEKAESGKNVAKKSIDGNNLSSYVDPESLKNISFNLETKNKNLVKHNLSQLNEDTEKKIEIHKTLKDVIDIDTPLIGNKRKIEVALYINKDKYEDYNEKNKKSGTSDDSTSYINHEIDLVNSPWLSKCLVVRIKDKELNNGKFLNKKAKVIDIDPQNEFIAEVEIITEDPNSNKIMLKIDQAYLEPVIPKEDSSVIILFGNHKNKVGQFKEIDLSRKSCTIRIDSKAIQTGLNNICKYMQ